MKVIGIAAVLLACSATPVAAQSAFDGTWKFDAANAQMPTKPFGWTIAKGMLACDTCTVPYTVPTDGAFHKVANQPYWDEVAVQIVDDRTMKQTWKKAGRVTDTTVSTASADGKTFAWKDVDTSAPSGQALESSGTNVRVTNGPAGSHAMSGTWRPGKLDSIADDAIVMTLKTAERVVTMVTPTGYQYSGTIGGPAVPIVGDLANTKAAVTMPNANTLVETDSRDGKTVGTYTYVVQPGGRTMATSYYDALRKTTTKAMAIKQ